MGSVTLRQRGQGHTKGKDSPRNKQCWEKWTPHSSCRLHCTQNWLKTQFSTSSPSWVAWRRTTLPQQSVTHTQEASPHFSSPFPPGVSWVVRKPSSCQHGHSPVLSWSPSPGESKGDSAPVSRDADPGIPAQALAAPETELPSAARRAKTGGTRVRSGSERRAQPTLWSVRDLQAAPDSQFTGDSAPCWQNCWTH